MSKKLLAAALAVLALSGCGPKAPAPTLHASMKEVIDPNADQIWDITNHATTGAFEPVPSRLTADRWSEIAQAGVLLRDRAKLLSEMQKVVVAKPGDKVADTDAGGQSASQIQAGIDADRASFSQHAREVADTGDAIVTASKTKDTAKLYAAVSKLDQQCESCHLKFWYPQEALPGQVK